jgi:hypothetical protein
MKINHFYHGCPSNYTFILDVFIANIFCENQQRVLWVSMYLFCILRSLIRLGVRVAAAHFDHNEEMRKLCESSL